MTKCTYLVFTELNRLASGNAIGVIDIWIPPMLIGVSFGLRVDLDGECPKEGGKACIFCGRFVTGSKMRMLPYPLCLGCADTFVDVNGWVRMDG